MGADPKLALRMLCESTRGFGRVYDLMGPGNAGVRQAILLALTGQKVPRSRAGVNAVREAFYSAFGIVGTHDAERERNLSRLACPNAERDSIARQAEFLGQMATADVPCDALRNRAASLLQECRRAGLRGLACPARPVVVAIKAKCPQRRT